MIKQEINKANYNRETSIQKPDIKTNFTSSQSENIKFIDEQDFNCNPETLKHIHKQLRQMLNIHDVNEIEIEICSRKI